VELSVCLIEHQHGLDIFHAPFDGYKSFFPPMEALDLRSA